MPPSSGSACSVDTVKPDCQTDCRHVPRRSSRRFGGERHVIFSAEVSPSQGSRERFPGGGAPAQRRGSSTARARAGSGSAPAGLSPMIAPPPLSSFSGVSCVRRVTRRNPSFVANEPRLLTRARQSSSSARRLRGARRSRLFRLSRRSTGRCRLSPGWRRRSRAWWPGSLGVLKSSESVLSPISRRRPRRPSACSSQVGALDRMRGILSAAPWRRGRPLGERPSSPFRAHRCSVDAACPPPRRRRGAGLVRWVGRKTPAASRSQSSRSCSFPFRRRPRPRGGRRAQSSSSPPVVMASLRLHTITNALVEPGDALVSSRTPSDEPPEFAVHQVGVAEAALKKARTRFDHQCGKHDLAVAEAARGQAAQRGFAMDMSIARVCRPVAPVSSSRRKSDPIGKPVSAGVKLTEIVDPKGSNSGSIWRLRTPSC